MATCGVFLIPPEGHPLYEAGSAVLGYDIRGEARFTSCLAGDLPEGTVTGWLGPAPTDGIHMTVAAGWLEFDECDLGEVDVRLAWLASRTGPFEAGEGRFHDGFDANHRALVATYRAKGGALHWLERQVVTLISGLRSGSRYESRRDALPEDRRRVLERDGDPNTGPFFVPHWTLASGLPGKDAYCQVREVVAARTPLFGDHRARTLPVDALYLVRLGADGFYRIAARYPLAGDGTPRREHAGMRNGA